MIKEAIFCNICGAHVYENTSIALFMIHGIAPTVGMRNTNISDKTEPSDVVLCENCELDVYSILINNSNIRKVKDSETG